MTNRFRLCLAALVGAVLVTLGGLVPVALHREADARPIALSLPSPFAHLLAQGYSNANPGAYWVPPGACNSTVSADATGTNGLTVTGASFTPVVQAQTDNTAAIHTHTYVCNINPPAFTITTGTGIQIIDATFFYGIVTSNLGTQVVTLASGTLNSLPVFSSITYPAAGTSETPSTVTPVRADSGTLALLPAVANFNATATTAGSFYSETFTPAAGTLPWKTTFKQLLLTVKFVNTTTSATITNSPGVLVRMRSQ
jgi:hypothetical protein